MPDMKGWVMRLKVKDYRQLVNKQRNANQENQQRELREIWKLNSTFLIRVPIDNPIMLIAQIQPNTTEI